MQNTTKIGYQMKTKILILLPLIAYIFSAQAQESIDGVIQLDELRKPAYRKKITIPDINGYKVLKCDLHTHSVFSDGDVWPNMRAEEAWEEGLDAIAITDHAEYLPNKKDLGVNHNRAYELAIDAAKKNKIILIKGIELTRRTPPGHFNALFIDDASNFIEDDAPEKNWDALMKAHNQNAFIIWNHPGWLPEIKGSYEWIPFVDSLYNKKALHGIEVVNGFWLQNKSLDWCIDNNLAVIGGSDIHNLIAHDYDLSKEYIHRTMTLVFAKDRTAESIREALEAGRTVAWASKYLVGKEELIRSLFDASVKILPTHFSKKDWYGTEMNFYEIENSSDLYFELELKSGKGTKKVEIHPMSSQFITAVAGEKTLSYDVISTYIRSDKHLNVTFDLR